MLRFLFWHTKEPQNASRSIKINVNPSQQQLNSFQENSEREQPLSGRASSPEPVIDDTQKMLETFRIRVNEVKGISLKMDELTKLYNSGEISKKVYDTIKSELSNYLSSSVGELFNLREKLELARVKAKLEWVKEKIGIKEFETGPFESLIRHDQYLKRNLYSSLSEWENLISDIDKALSSLKVEDEVFIIEQYLLLTKERRLSQESIEICRRRLSEISEKWDSLRRERIEQIVNLDLRLSQIKEEINEVEVRFSVGEFNESVYESKVNILKKRLKLIENEISEIRNYIENMDTKIFRCSELLRGNQ